MSGEGFLGEVEVIDYLRKVKKLEIYIPMKDIGIDFVAKGKHFYEIQVKTSVFQKHSYFWFDLHKQKMVYSRNTYYILVCKSIARRNFMGKSHNFIVIPSIHIKRWIENGSIIGKRNNENVFNLFVYPKFEEKTWIYKNKGRVIDLTRYWNNFKNIR